MTLPISIAPDLLQIHEVLDGETVIAVEITDGAETFAYHFDQIKYPSLRIGKVPRKNRKEDFERRLVYCYPPRTTED